MNGRNARDDEERQGASPAAFFSGEAFSSGGFGRRATAALLATRAFARWLFGGRRPYNVLRIELAGELPEMTNDVRLRALDWRRPSLDLVTLLAVLRSARDDPSLGLVLIDVLAVRAGWSRIQSVRRALAALRAAGKRVWAYLPQPGMQEYYLASAADRVFLAPSALFDATGLASEVTFLKGALDKLGIEAQLARAGRFKSAAEPFTRTDMSAEHRAMVEGLLDDLYVQLVSDIANARRLDADAVRAAFEKGPLLAAEAERQGLVDARAYPDEIEAELEARFGDPAPIDLPSYRRRRALAMRRAALGAPTIGLLTVTGPIGLDHGFALPVGRASEWRTFRREISALARERRVRAVVLRVDSPGGSGIASDLMWREIIEARRWKPVFVSMGDIAASGGYYLAAAADHVTAEPATLTGSIGVLAGKPVLRGLYDQLGITKELVVRGNAARHSDYVALDHVELGRLREEAEAFYSDFVAKVAAGRGLSREAVETVAEGRVWTGRQAAEHGLVDALGGLERTLSEVRQRLGLPIDAPVALERRPRGRSWWQMALGWNVPASASGGERFAARMLAALTTGGLVEEDAAADPFGVLTPMIAGERVLAAMPFWLRFVGRSDALVVPPAMARPFARLLAVLLGAWTGRLVRPPLVL